MRNALLAATAALALFAASADAQTRTVRFSFNADTFDHLPRESHSRPPSQRDDRNTFSLGNAIDGQSPALGRLDRVLVRNHLVPGTLGHPGLANGIVRSDHRPLEADDTERISGESLASGIRLTFPRDWEGDGDLGGFYPIGRRSWGPNPTVWEIIDRGRNFEYMAGPLRARLPEFFSWLGLEGTENASASSEAAS
jgi:hypothetical protein